MTDNLRDRIERIIETHTLINGADECTCGVLWQIQDGFGSTDGSTCWDNHLAGVIADFLVTDEKREPAVPENKSLRDRIIAAIAGADRDWNSDYPDMADAVIAELGLDDALQDCRCQLRYLSTPNDKLKGVNDE